MPCVRPSPAARGSPALDIYLPIAELPVNIFLLLGMGLAVGFVSGLFGVGGGFLMTPLLIFVGIPPAIAVASQSAQIAASSFTSVITYWRRKAVDAKLGGVLVGGGFVGTFAGVLFFNAMMRAGQLDLVIVVSYVALFSTVGSLMLVESARTILRQRRTRAVPPRRVPRKRPTYFAWPLRLRFHRSKLYASALPLAGLAFAIAFAGAVLGIGGGFLLIPALIYGFHVPTAVVIGTSSFQIMFTMLAATLLHSVSNGAVDIVLSMLLMLGGVVGAQLGARAGRNLRSDVFRLLLALLVLAVGLRFAVELVVRPDDPFSLSVVERAK